MHADELETLLRNTRAPPRAAGVGRAEAAAATAVVSMATTALAEPLLENEPSSSVESPHAAIASTPPSITPSSTSQPSVYPSASGRKNSLRHWAVVALSRAKARRTTDVGRPSLASAAAYMRYFLPKTANGKLLSLFCSEAEFSAHVGSGVAIYMHFVKMTGWMFAVATLIAVPQFIANARGAALSLEWPLDAAACPSQGGLMGLITTAAQMGGYVFYSSLLGNVSFESTAGIPHLVSELLLSSMFCICEPPCCACAVHPCAREPPCARVAPGRAAERGSRRERSPWPVPLSPRRLHASPPTGAA